MKIKQTIGIDISKLTFDVRIYNNQMYASFNNENKGFTEMLKWVTKNNPFKTSETLYIFEHTGLYSHLLSVFLTKHSIPFTIVSGLEVKRSLGIVRGKDDKIDATKLARYAYRLRDEIRTYKLPTQQIQVLKRLLSLRERLVKQRAGYKVSYKEQKRTFTKKENQVIFDVEQQMVSLLSKKIIKVEQAIDTVITSNQNLKTQYELITSVKSVGSQTALFIMVYTHAFTKFTTWRKFAAYGGIAPFPNRSGTSIKGKNKVSHLANKKIKCLLDQCAKSAIQHNQEMKLYYNKKVEQGKNKMSVINSVRNKIIARVFAVVERGTPYVDFLKYAA